MKITALILAAFGHSGVHDRMQSVRASWREAVHQNRTEMTKAVAVSRQDVRTSREVEDRLSVVAQTTETAERTFLRRLEETDHRS